MLALALQSESNVSSTAVVVNELGVAVDHMILGRGGRISKDEMEGFLNNVQKIYENNTTVDVIILNTALQHQSIQLQKSISDKIGDYCVGTWRTILTCRLHKD